MRLWLLTLLLLIACSSKSLQLEERWRPLVQIEESIFAAGFSDGACFTFGESVCVRDLDAFLAARPGIELEASLTHERVHAINMGNYGIYLYCLRYGTDPEFALAEEQAAFAAEARFLANRGHRLAPETIARMLERYWNLSGQLISYRAALRWANRQESAGWPQRN